jgi:DNA-binding SARP family transcriptional activator
MGLAPDYVLVHAKLARLYTLESRYAEAEAQWKRQLELDPYLIQGVQELASLYAVEGKLAEARAMVTDGLQRFPERLDLQQNLRTLDAALAKRGRKR